MKWRGRRLRALRRLRSWLRRKEARHMTKGRINKLARLIVREEEIGIGDTRPSTWEARS